MQTLTAPAHPPAHSRRRLFLLPHRQRRRARPSPQRRSPSRSLPLRRLQHRHARANDSNGYMRELGVRVGHLSEVTTHDCVLSRLAPALGSSRGTRLSSHPRNRSRNRLTHHDLRFGERHHASRATTSSLWSVLLAIGYPAGMSSVDQDYQGMHPIRQGYRTEVSVPLELLSGSLLRSGSNWKAYFSSFSRSSSMQGFVLNCVP